MTQSNNRKPSSLQASIWTVKLFVGAVAAAGVASYALAGPEYYPMAAVAALTAIVIMMTADHVGRGWSSVLLVPLLVICGGFQAMNLEHSYQFYFEAPAKAAYEKKLEPLQAEADRTAGRLKTAEALLDAFQPEKVDCSPCRNTRREAAERDAQRRAPLALAVETAKAEKKAAAEALDTIGAREHGTRLRDLAALFGPDGPAATVDARQVQIDSMNPPYEEQVEAVITRHTSVRDDAFLLGLLYLIAHAAPGPETNASAP